MNAQNETRTRTALRPKDFKSFVSTIPPPGHDTSFILVRNYKKRKWGLLFFHSFFFYFIIEMYEVLITNKKKRHPQLKENAAILK